MQALEGGGSVHGLTLTPKASLATPTRKATPTCSAWPPNPAKGQAWIATLIRSA
jgi:hypothetical protein